MINTGAFTHNNDDKSGWRLGGGEEVGWRVRTARVKCVFWEQNNINLTWHYENVIFIYIPLFLHICIIYMYTYVGQIT